MKAYGINWPDSLSELDIEKYCYRHQDKIKANGGIVKGQYYHAEKGMKMMWPPDLLDWHYWCYEMLDLWVKNRFMIVWGAAATGKSNFFGALCSWHYMCAPNKTGIFLTSTSLESLQNRIWESVERYMNYAINKHKAPFAMTHRPLLVMNKADFRGDEIDYKNTKTTIHGMGVCGGNSKLIGGHLPYIVVVMDEMQETPPSVLSDAHNLSKGCQEFKFCGIGNPPNWSNILVTNGLPESGKEVLTPDTHRWRNKKGETIHLNGMKSPAIIEDNGAKRYHYLIKQSEIENDYPTAEDRRTLEYYQYVLGWPAPSDISNTILDMPTIMMHNANHPAEFEGQVVKVAGLDPAFTSGGDACALSICSIGKLASGNVAIALDEMIRVPIVLDSDDPVIYHIVKKVKLALDAHGVELEDLAIDDSGTQSVADVFDREYGVKTHRVNFGGAATNRLISADKSVKASDRYNSKVTELWYVVRDLVKSGNVRGLRGACCEQFCIREVKNTGRKKQVESKGDMKSRTSGKSPDEADSFVCAVDLARSRYGLMPFGSSVNILKNLFDNKSFSPVKQLYNLANKYTSGRIMR
ncbi:hypothetical protein EOL73_00030 [Candidatus Saccharibacteria bacterium]|nr:hypothetical protein [Candidatus Saccharibacteria bacterium]